MQEFLTNLLKSKNGISSMRFAFLGWMVVLSVSWMFICWVKKDFVDIPVNVMNLTLGVLGAKVGQKWVEGKKPEETTPPTK